MEYKLSPSNLNLLEECPRCFWLHFVKNIKRPSGPMSSIPIKMDSIIKHYFDRYRNQGKLPPMIEGMIKGKLPENMPKTLKNDEGNGIILWGRPDDYFELQDGNIVPFDHKTKSKEPEDIHSAYQLQMNVYSYLLKVMGYKTTNKAYLAFYYPDECDLHDGMPFHCKILEVKTDFNSVKKVVERANTILNGQMPDPDKNCEYCKWIENASILK
jgi:CRISPR/Cas system-associated exonuclease Cas4 (RecB family)